MSKRSELVGKAVDRILEEANTIPADQIPTIHRILSDVVSDYDIEKRITDVVPTDNVIPEWYGVFLAGKKVAGRTVDTLKLYNYYMMDFFVNKPAPLECMDTTLMVRYLYDYQKRKGICNNTLNQCRIIINSVFQWAANEGFVPRNFVGNIDPIKYVEKLRNPLTEEEVVMLRDACETYRERAIVDVLLSTGIRVSELVNLKWNDINMDKKSMTIFGKGSKYRTVFFNSSAKVSLLRYKLVRLGDDSHVFVSNVAPFKKLSKGSVENIMYDLSKRKEFSAHVSPHILRHTFATHALSHGMPIEQLRILLGHEKLDTTLIYAKIDMSQVNYEYRKCFGA